MSIPDGPPKTPPYFADLWGGRDAGLDPHEASRFAIDDFAAVPELLPVWVLDDEARGLPQFTLLCARHEPGRVAELQSGGLTIRFATDPSGYVRVTARLHSETLLTAYIDQPYEDYDLWPPGAAFPELRTADAPGRIGKRRSWVVLDTRTWPTLAPYANDAGYVMLRDRE